MNIKRGSPLSIETRQRLTLAIAKHGLAVVVSAAGCSRQALVQALAGLGVLPGTTLCVQRGLDRLEALDLRGEQVERIARGES